jgi:hypothetical protein
VGKDYKTGKEWVDIIYWLREDQMQNASISRFEAKLTRDIIYQWAYDKPPSPDLVNISDLTTKVVPDLLLNTPTVWVKKHF